MGLIKHKRKKGYLEKALLNRWHFSDDVQEVWEQAMLTSGEIKLHSSKTASAKPWGRSLPGVFADQQVGHYGLIRMRRRENYKDEVKKVITGA